MRGSLGMVDGGQLQDLLPEAVDLRGEPHPRDLVNDAAGRGTGAPVLRIDMKKMVFI